MTEHMQRKIARLTRAGSMVAMLALLSACASGPGAQTPAEAVQSAVAPEMPLLRLPPQALGHTLAERQRVTVMAPQRAPQVLDVLLEADGQSVRLALMQMGQVAACLVWDGQSMQVTQSRWWPKEVSAERILGDMQMARWPLAAIQAALPAPWSMTQEGQTRILRHGAEPEMLMQVTAPHVTEVSYLRGGWQLRIESMPLSETLSNEAAP